MSPWHPAKSFDPQKVNYFSEVKAMMCGEQEGGI
jgi:hypothetical protein